MKIRIFGGIGSGKSTLASKLSEALKIPAYSTDDFRFTSGFKRIRTIKQREMLIQKTLKRSWIVEGVHFSDWTKQTYSQADCIVILDIPLLTLFYRITTRTLKNKDGKYGNKISYMFKMIKQLFEVSTEVKKYKEIAANTGKKLYIITPTNYNRVYSEIIKNNQKIR